MILSKWCRNCKKRRPDNWTDENGKHHFGCSGREEWLCNLYEEK